MSDNLAKETLPQSDDSGLDLLISLAANKRTLLLAPLVAGIIAVGVAFMLPKWYTATTKILPPQQTQSNAVAILGQLGALTGGAAGQALGIKNPSDIYVAMLKSRTVADVLIARFDLRKVYGEDLLFYARKELSKNSTISASRDGVITIEVDDKDAERASHLANAYVDELRQLTLHLAVGEASQRRLFFEGQLKQAKSDLVTAETELAKFTKSSGLMNPQGQIGLSVAAAAALRAQITAKEIQLAAMRSFATNENPDLKRTNQELLGLRSELAKMEKDVKAGKGDVMVPFGEAAEVGLEYVRRYRDVKHYETLFEVLARQYEIARIDEAKDATLIQVLDKAVTPERKSWPPRTVIVAVSMLAMLVFAIVFVLLKLNIQRSLRDPEKALRFETVRQLLFGTRTRRSPEV